MLICIYIKGMSLISKFFDNNFQEKYSLYINNENSVEADRIVNWCHFTSRKIYYKFMSNIYLTQIHFLNKTMKTQYIHVYIFISLKSRLAPSEQYVQKTHWKNMSFFFFHTFTSFKSVKTFNSYKDLTIKCKLLHVHCLWCTSFVLIIMCGKSFWKQITNGYKNIELLNPKAKCDNYR